LGATERGDLGTKWKEKSLVAPPKWVGGPHPGLKKSSGCEGILARTVISAEKKNAQSTLITDNERGNHKEGKSPSAKKTHRRFGTQNETKGGKPGDVNL